MNKDTYFQTRIDKKLTKEEQKESKAIDFWARNYKKTDAFIIGMREARGAK